MELTATLKTLFIETAASLKGSTRRLFMARTVRQLGPGGQRLAQRELGWNRETLRKGTHELQAGVTCCDAFRLRGCQPAEARLPHLLTDIQQIVDGQSQTDPQFRNQRLYTRLTAAAVRHQLIVQKGYTDAQLPLAETIGKKLNRLGYPPKRSAKACPKKDCPDRRYLCPTEPGPCGGGGGSERTPPFYGCQSHGPRRQLFARRPKSRSGRSGRSCFSFRGAGDACGHLAASQGRAVCVRRDFQGHERLSGRSLANVVANAP